MTFVNPATGTPGVWRHGSVRITFSEPVNVTTLTADNIVLSAGGTPLATTFTIASGNQAVTVTPQLPLPTATPVTVTITGVEDVAGHAVPATSSTFTTGNAPDTTAPTVVSTSPVYSDPSVPVNSIFEWSYSEPIDVSTVLGQTSVLYDYTLGMSPAARYRSALTRGFREVCAAVPTGGRPDLLGESWQRRGPCGKLRRQCEHLFHHLDGH